MYNDWIALAELKDLVVCIVAEALNCLANEVLEVGQTSKKPLVVMEKDLLKVGSSSEYLLDSQAAHKGLPFGTAKHLL